MDLIDRIENDAFTKFIWDMKYAPSSETSPATLFGHIATEFANVYPKEKLIKFIQHLEGNNITDSDVMYPHNYFKHKFYNLLVEGKFLPGGRVIAGMGMLMLDKNRKNTLQNCYGLAIEEDSIDGIFDFCKRTATSYAWGGGVGTCLSGLRPRNSKVNNASRTSTGAPSFLLLMDASAATIGQNGRRAAFLAFMYVSHPDIMEFITCKKGGALSNMNISVGISDAFMKAVEEGKDWELWYPDKCEHSKYFDNFQTVENIADCYKYEDVEYFHVEADNSYRVKTIYKTIPAKEIWDAICENAWEEGCPGILFIDAIKRDCRYEYTNRKFHTPNPCSELLMPANGICNLGAMNLAEYINDNGEYEEFETDVALCTFFLDCVLEYSIENKLLPFDEQIKVAEDLRILGLGVTGVYDYLAKQNIRYGSPEGMKELEEIMSDFAEHVDNTSIMMGQIFGVYPLYDETKANHSARRNAQLRTIAPTGTISLLLGSSTGIEPVFALEYEKRVRTTDEQGKEVWVPEIIRHPLYERLKNNSKFDKKIWVEASDLDYIARVDVQSICQKYIDSSISSTVNLPNNVTIEDVSNVYMHAWRSNCKGITIFRDGCFRTGVLKKTTDVVPALEEAKILDRDSVSILSGKTIKIPLTPSWYCTVNTTQNNNPVEVFINAGKSGSNIKAETEAYGRLISLYLQEGGNVERVIDSLKGIQGREPIFKNGWIIQSHPDAIAKALEKILVACGTQIDKEPEVCPKCGMNTFIAVAGCGNCVNQDCLHTNCG